MRDCVWVSLCVCEHWGDPTSRQASTEITFYCFAEQKINMFVATIQTKVKIKTQNLLKHTLCNYTRWTGMIIQHPFHLQIAPNFSAIIPLTQVPLKEPCLMEYGSSVVSYMHHVHHNPHTNTFTISSLLKIWPLLEAAIFWQKWERFQCIQMYSREMDHAARVAWKVYLEV